MKDEMNASNKDSHIQESDAKEAKPIQHDSSEECFNIMQHEYNHVFERGNKLDNKVNIALTFSGVLFIFIIDLLNIVNQLIFPLNQANTMKFMLYVIIALAVFILYGYSIYLLISILNPTKYQRFNADVLLRKNLQYQPTRTVYNYVSIKYSISINQNNEVLEKQYKNYRKAIILEMVMIGLSVILYIFKYNFL